VSTLSSEFPSPVVGSINNELNATSEGVHLYADPEKYYETYPLLYADCEGLNAGEQIPFALSGSRVRRRSEASSAKEFVKRGLQGVSREISWVRKYENSSRRDFAVRNLYPRILYTFSDVIVFVQKNPKFGIPPLKSFETLIRPKTNAQDLGIAAGVGRCLSGEISQPTGVTTRNNRAQRCGPWGREAKMGYTRGHRRPLTECRRSIWERAWLSQEDK
jgi:hypothetical protein